MDISNPDHPIHERLARLEQWQIAQDKQLAQHDAAINAIDANFRHITDRFDKLYMGIIGLMGTVALGIGLQLVNIVGRK